MAKNKNKNIPSNAVMCLMGSYCINKQKNEAYKIWATNNIQSYKKMKTTEEKQFSAGCGWKMKVVRDNQLIIVALDEQDYPFYEEWKKKEQSGQYDTEGTDVHE